MTNDDGPSGISDHDGTDSAMLSMDTLVISVWREPDHVAGFRARVTSRQLPGNEPTTVTAADRDEVLAIVRHWLFARSGASDRD
jgi:hypothetical protein